ncbi:MAG: hypothetical protein V1847_04690 [Candidatus Diapherotrites archaeon]
MEKTVTISLYLFGKPEWEFGDKKFGPKVIQSKGNELNARLHEIADNLQKLSANGWEYELCLYDISLWKNCSKTAAEKELRSLGIREEVVELEEE